MAVTASTCAVSRAKNHRLILRAIHGTEPDGIALDDLEAALADDLPSSLVRGHLIGLADDGKVWWDQQSPRRVHVC